MFGKLKEKLLNATKKITEKIYKKGEAEEVKKQNIETKRVVDKDKNISKSKVITSYNDDIKKDNKKEEKKNISFFDRFYITRNIKKVIKKEVVILEEDI